MDNGPLVMTDLPSAAPSLSPTVFVSLAPGATSSPSSITGSPSRNPTITPTVRQDTSKSCITDAIYIHDQPLNLLFIHFAASLLLILTLHTKNVHP